MFLTIILGRGRYDGILGGQGLTRGEMKAEWKGKRKRRQLWQTTVLFYVVMICQRIIEEALGYRLTIVLYKKPSNG